jgi:hypothetical protein
LSASNAVRAQGGQTSSKIQQPDRLNAPLHRRGRHPEIGEVIEVRDAIGPPLIARIHAIHHDPQAPVALAKWNVAAIEIGP